MFSRFICAVVLSGTVASMLVASDEIMVIEQDYNIIEQSKGGAQARDVRQKLYIHKDFICIDEFGGKQEQNAPTESIMLDFKNRKIINLDHSLKKSVTESFDERRRRIESRKKQIESDLSDMAPGAQKTRAEKLYFALLDDKRRFALSKDPGADKTIGEAVCKQVKVIVEDAPEGAPFEACLHPSLELPYDNTEVLYLLQIIGKRLAEFLHQNKETFKYVPMELHLDLAAGGRLDTKVIRVALTDNSKLDFTSRGKLGSPFDVPTDYEERQKKPGPKTEKNDGSQERPD